MKPVKGRFAPSPTGRMHLGNVYAALMSWLWAKSQGGTWLLRIEDLDPQRSRMEYALQIEDDLHWLGLDWDEGGTENRGHVGPYIQSRRGEIYRTVLDRLTALGLTYPCTCSRADIMATQAPHQTDGRIIYSGRCRPAALGGKGAPENGRPVFYNSKGAALARPAATRLYVPDVTVEFDDLHCGHQTVSLARECGDFILRRADGAWAYQLAVVADDALMGVTQVIRGDDLLLSAAQQIHLFSLLGYEPPVYGHIPLLTDAAGRRLSKRDRSLEMSALRARYTPAALLGRLAHLTGLTLTPAPVTARALLPLFNPSLLPHHPIPTCDL